MWKFTAGGLAAVAMLAITPWALAHPTGDAQQQCAVGRSIAERQGRYASGTD